MAEVAQASKISIHGERIGRYIRGEPILPVTLELDLTSRCSRICADCPSCRSSAHMHLDEGFLGSLLARLEGETRGLLLTGGEPTLSPLFPRALALARRRGFVDVAVVTNGSQLREDRVVDALLEHASTIRLSMYDWDENSCGGIRPSLERIGHLRSRIDATGSRLRIGVSALTNRERAPRLAELGRAVSGSGAHWIYYHPMCRGWGDGHLVKTDQTGVAEAIRAYRGEHAGGDFRIFYSSARYEPAEVRFDAYHAAHFLLVVGADGKNYLGPEVKYQERFAIADFRDGWQNGALHDPARLARIGAINSRNYSAIGSKHRGVLYSEYIDRLLKAAARGGGSPPAGRKEDFWFPNVL